MTAEQIAEATSSVLCALKVKRKSVVAANDALKYF